MAFPAPPLIEIQVGGAHAYGADHWFRWSVPPRLAAAPDIGIWIG